MASLKGYIVTTIEEYDSKQQEIADILKVSRYAGGRKTTGGITIPDIKLIDGNLFIPYELGTDTIDDSNILQG